ncbi:MAG: hypothetical protein K940chlam1_00459 [Candidatus Anoxychlamydiales bacterium]|nr:hypothetical protein [Candidatus Anoxychlamydiales bacterium]NGX35274.1 hypothetical protein [Candidatus Anoxychlamydiales bacterium]
MQLQLDFLKNSSTTTLLEEDSYLENTLKSLLKKLVTDDIFLEKNGLKKAELFFNENLPILKWSRNEKTKSCCITLMCKHRKNATNFFYDMVSRWLISQKKLNVEFFFSADFTIQELSDEKFMLMEAILPIESEEDFEDIEKNKRTFETEIRLGIASDFHAKRIIEFKGLSSDRKTAMVQEKIGSLMQKRPKDFGKNIFSEMQQFLIMSRDEFKSQRDYHHISRIISILYMIRKLIKQNIDETPDKRQIILKFLKTKLKSNNNQEKTVLGILVGLNFLKEHEVFEKKHLSKAIFNFLPDVKIVENSFFLDKTTKNKIQTCYIEIEKPSGLDFTNEEIQVLKNELPTYLKGNIEHLIHPIFMPRNEEEIVKNMLTLSNQLKYVHDIPQVIISFDKQTHIELIFNVVLLRVLRPLDCPIKDLFKKTKPSFRFTLEKVKKVGIIRRKYLKEANVFSITLESSAYLRSDHSVDINRARSDILNELHRLFGEVRDYNGGMIFKQNEAYLSLKAILGQIGKHYDSLLEKYFYAIKPVEMTAIVKPDILKNLFLMLINTIKREETKVKKNTDLLFKQDLKQLYIIIPDPNQDKKKQMKEAIDNLNIVSSELISFSLSSHDVSYLGYVFINENKATQKMFFETIQNSLK